MAQSCGGGTGRNSTGVYALKIETNKPTGDVGLIAQLATWPVDQLNNLLIKRELH